MTRAPLLGALAVLLLLAAAPATAQSDYQVVTLDNGGKIVGTVEWSGPLPHLARFPINKDPQVCDPDHNKTVDLERLLVGPQGGVANTVVYLQDITRGKAMDLPVPRRHLDQKHCRYEPHILLVPQNGVLQMKSSDATLHTLHMEGAASYNLPFPFQDRVIERPMPEAGLVTLRCNGGHTWMNAEMVVARNPYYAVTDESGHFELSDVPAGTYTLVAWHEGWGLVGVHPVFDVLTEKRVQRPLFTDPRTWEKKVTVTPNGSSEVDFTLSEK
ncbi:MAG TPA: hypothetical protein VL155_03870 [Terriglobales bacterium]|jgi:hypothetical protein|nr:hypothetical protein [Terriglobales bacterium]